MPETVHGTDISESQGRCLRERVEPDDMPEGFSQGASLKALTLLRRAEEFASQALGKAPALSGPDVAP